MALSPTCFSNDPADYYVPDNTQPGRNAFIQCQSTINARKIATIFGILGIVGIVIFAIAYYQNKKSNPNFSESWMGKLPLAVSIGGLVVLSGLLTVGGWYMGLSSGKRMSSASFDQLDTQWRMQKGVYNNNFLAFRKQRATQQMANAMAASASANQEMATSSMINTIGSFAR
jgi:hypothetical protein